MTCGYNDIFRTAGLELVDPLHYRYRKIPETVFPGDSEDFTKTITLDEEKWVQIFVQAQLDLSSRDFSVTIVVDGTELYNDREPGATKMSRVRQSADEFLNEISMHAVGVKQMSAGPHSVGLRVSNNDATESLEVIHTVIKADTGVTMQSSQILT
jgi:hypothetical protein